MKTILRVSVLCALAVGAAGCGSVLPTVSTNAARQAPADSSRARAATLTPSEVGTPVAPAPSASPSPMPTIVPAPSVLRAVPI
jgi:hypothetical protein